MEKLLYLCDPSKNNECNKSECMYEHPLLGGCFFTSNAEYARDSKAPIPGDVIKFIPDIEREVVNAAYEKWVHDVLYGSGGIEPIGLLNGPS